MPVKQVTVKAPATSANLGPGFDVFGIALEQPNDQVMLSTIREGVEMQVSGMGAKTISLIPEKNTAGRVAEAMIKDFKLKTGLQIHVEKGIFPGKGLGSSAASAAAVAVGINTMFELGLSNKQLIVYAAKGEVASAGSEHADNVSAAVCGNFVLIRSYHPLEIINLECPKDMELAVAMPKIITPPNKTEKARAVVPKLVPLEKHVFNLSRAVAMAAGFAMGDVDIIGKSMVDDIVEPARASLVPGYTQVRENALNAGALGVTISGAGPSMIAIINRRTGDASKVAAAMREGFQSSGYDADAFATKPGKGSYVIGR
ncbi:MAG: homoserine kinase [Candidatus Bathyarchaeota archaeon]|uniref:homoserine kinase n=1 Tax=Candidatus Bathycorpusculum sp. TaxID=2994959 RepID=UPI0028344B0F|nr:homoserine kinase [Candidatus Termiticorpusculum sp.]MCL2257318.1 homoserine kinase [Candidatus Termiticorpusculum sp.]